MISVRLTQCFSNDSEGGANFHIPYRSGCFTYVLLGSKLHFFRKLWIFREEKVPLDSLSHEGIKVPGLNGKW